MTVVTADAPSTVGGKLFDTVSQFLEEARSGPLHSGMTETLDVNGTTIELSASRDWGVRFTRTLADGTVQFRHISGADLTLECAASAFAEIVTR